MDSYLNEIARYPMMTPEEEIRLGRLVCKAEALKKLERELNADEKKAIRRGERAKKRFVEANLRLVVYIAKKYAANKPLAMDILDLIQEGSVGLMRAVEKFDPERGYKFSTYSYWWCRQAMGRALHTQEFLIRRPHPVIDIASKMPKAIHEEYQRLGRKPTVREIAGKLKVKEEEIYLLMERGSTTVSLDSTLAHTNGMLLSEIVADPSTVDSDNSDTALDIELKMPMIKMSLTLLTEQEQDVVAMRFGLYDNEPHTYEAIAKQFGVSRERIRQIVDRSLRKIRYSFAMNMSNQRDNRTDEAPLELAKEYTPAPYRGPVTPLNQFPTAAEVRVQQCA